MGGRRETGMRKAQSSMEYLLVMLFVFTLLVGIIILAYAQSATFTNDVGAAQIKKVGGELTDAANTVYYAGPPTKKTIRLYFPEHIRNISISGNSIVFIMQGNAGQYDYVVSAATNMTGSLKTYAGVHVITLEAGNTVVNVSG